MAKKRKTREEKKLADLRHNFTPSLVSENPIDLKLKIQPNKLIQQAKVSTIKTSVNTYPYLAKDLSKTGILTAGILAFQVILFLLIKNHMIAIPGLIY